MINFLRRTPLYPVLAGIYPRLHNFYIWLVWQICYLLPVDQHKIVFSNFNGGGFGDNARYIAEECIRRKIPYKLYWVCSNPAFPKGAEPCSSEHSSFCIPYGNCRLLGRYHQKALLF